MSGLNAALDRRIGIEEYLVWSTIATVLLSVPLKGTFHAGYAVAIVNSLILLVFDRLAIHRHHMFAILALAGFSVLGAQLSGTPLTAVIAQILGISVMSVYFFSALTNLGLSVSRWMELYIYAAFSLALLGIALWVIEKALHIGDGRLKSIYSEPALYVFVTLPALGYCVNYFVSERRYGGEMLVFLLSYAMADSSLGFLGVMLIALFTYAPRLKGWQIFAGGGLMAAAVGSLYIVSTNFRLRAISTFMAIANQDLSGSTPSTFALLSNLYVAAQSFLAHPLTGIGIGGYGTAYDKYIGNIEGAGTTFLVSLQLNRDDANSMFLRVAAELGLPGLLVLLGFLIVCARVKGPRYLHIRNAVLPYLIIRMGRGGHYFSVELYFFVGIYLLNYLQSRRASRSASTSLS